MNILVTGSEGHIGKSIASLQIEGVKFFNGCRKTINLFDKLTFKEHVLNNKIDIIIHCAIQGGKRGLKDSSDNFYNNLLMAENVLNAVPYVNKIINIASGAEFDRQIDIANCNEEEIFNRCPLDYYGLAKNIIAKRFANKNSKTYNIRVFGCFDENEINSRFIKSCIINNLTNNDILIHQDKIMDFIYMEDFLKIIKFYLLNENIKHKDINACYQQKLKLSEIASFINNISNNQVSIKIENLTKGLSYTGDFTKLESININLTGLTTGIIKTYNTINENIYRWT